MLKQTSGNHDVTSGVVDGLLGTLCFLHISGDDEKSNEEKSKTQDISRIALDIIDIDSENQLTGLKTLPALRRPDFLYGKMNAATASQVQKAVIASRTCRDMCAEWAEHAMASDRTSNINDKILKWCQNECFCADPVRSKVQQADIKRDAGNRDKVALQMDAAKSDSSKKSSLGNMFRKIFFCGYRPAEAKIGEGSEVKEVPIFIQRLNGTIFAVNVKPDKPQVDKPGSDSILTEKVGMLKKKIYQEKGIPPDLQLLVFENTNLVDEKALHECRILPKSTIHLIQLRSVLGVEDSVTVTATEERGIEFKKKTFPGLYRWYRDGQQRPDVYMGEFLNGRFQGVGQVVYQDGGYYRGEWADDQQHGFGVQRWASGAVYCGKWDRDTENGWGAYFVPSSSPSQHNPHSAQMLFIGHFRNGCPTDGMVIECTDFRQLTTESFTITQCDAAAKDILAQKFRVYDTCYDGVTAFWQLPIPNRKRGLFDLKFKLCEYEVHRVDRPLAHKSTLQEIWYKWIPNPKMGKKEKANKTLGGDGDQAAEADTLLPTISPKQTMYETFHFHGTCIRDNGGHFPCPTEGVLSFDSKTRGPQNKMKNELLVEYTAKFKPCSNDNPTLQHLEGRTKYAIPASDSLAKDGKSMSKDGKDIKSLLCEFLNIFLLECTDQERLAGLITHIEFEGELHRTNFPLHGIMLVGGEIMKVDFDGETSIQRFVSHISSGKVDGAKDNKTSTATNEEGAEKSDSDQDDDDDYETETYDDSSWGEMERYCINFEKWMRQKQESKLVVKLHVPTTEPPARQDQISVLRKPSDAMKEAAKMQAYGVWQPTGVLTRRRQGFPLESYVMETVYSGAGFVFEGWSKKVFCPKRGIFKLLIENDPKSKRKSNATDEDRNSLSKGAFDFDVDLEECILLPGSEDWFRYALTRMKMGYIQKLKIEHTKLNEELIQLKCYFANAKNTLSMKMKELTSASNEDQRIKQDEVPNEDLVKDSYPHQIRNIFSLFPEGFMEKSSKQPKSSKEIEESKQKVADLAKKKLSQILFSVVEKELEAAKTNELCTGVALVENTSCFSQAKENMKRHRRSLKQMVDDISKKMEAANGAVEKLSKNSEKLNAGVKQGLPGQAETSAQAKAKKARLAVELARLDPSISKVRMSIVRRTIRLLQGIEKFEKAANVHQKLMLAKAGARLNSDAALYRQKLFIRALAQGCLTDLDLDADDSDLLGVLKERTKDDLRKQINSASVDSRREAELLHLQEELKNLEGKECEDDIRATDLNAEMQIAIARLGAEEAESNLWSEWSRSAKMEENDRPAQGPSTGIRLKLAALDEANKRLRNALREAKKDADLQFRKSAPASEVHPKADLCKTAWMPETAVSPDNLAKAVSKLVVQAQRVIHLSYLQDPTSKLESPPLNDSARMCKVITDAKRELQSLTQLHKGAVISFPASL